MSGKFIFIHTLVANAFLNKENFKSIYDEDKNLIDINKLEVNHIDENPENNRVDNLEWCTHKYNCNYGNHGKKISNSTSMEIEQYDLKGNFIKNWKGLRNIERILKISSSNICECCKGNRKTAGGFKWKHKPKHMKEDV